MQNIIATAVVLLTMFVAIFLVNKAFESFISRSRAKLPLKFAKSLITVMIVVSCLYAILLQFEITKEVGGALLQSGTLIIAIATFAAQKALGNVISGFSLSASKPCDIGQKIKVMNGSTVIAEGIVTDMTMRHIVITQYDGQSCIVPNGIVDDSVIINTNYVENVGNFMEFEIGYDADIDKAREIILGICRDEPTLLDVDKMKVMVSRLTANGIVLKFTAKTKTLNESFEVCSNLRKRVVEAFRENGITIPYNTLDVNISEKK